MTGLYIKRIEIDSLWKGTRHIIWDLKPGVNVLSGINGVGKSTILRKTIRRLTLRREELERNYAGVHLTFEPEEADSVRFDIIRGTDRPLISADVLSRVTEARLGTELDWQLYLLQRRSLDYQVNVGNKMIELLGGDEEQRSMAPSLSLPKRKFQDMIDGLFSYTRKKIDRKSNDIVFYQDGERLSPYKLSSGEKQMLVILLTVLVRDGNHCVLFMDEPEASLHIEWQQKLIGMIRDLNPNVQLVLSTHSPAVIMEGWLDAVTEVEDISTAVSG